MITRIEAYNYRCFPKLSVDLDRYQVLAGANGAGKTTLLDIPTLLGDLIDTKRAAFAFVERREDAPPRAGTLVDLLHKGRGDQIAFAIEAKLPDPIATTFAETTLSRLTPTPTHLRYELRLNVSPRELTVAEEYLFLFSEHGARPVAGSFPQGISRSGTELRRSDWKPVLIREGRAPARFIYELPSPDSDYPPLRIQPEALALSAVPPDETLFPATLWLTQLLRLGVVFFDPDWDLLRRPAPPGSGDRLTRSGENSPWLAMDLATRDPDRFRTWIDHVQTALPQVVDIRAVEREEDHFAYFSVEYAGGHRVTSSGLSDGTLRILALTLLPYLNDDVMPALLVTEEPENGIHPQAIETVVTSLSSLYDSQVWVSTHSPIVLAQSELADVLAARLNKDGSVSVIPGNAHPRLRDWHGTLDIGTLFAAGVLS